MKTKEPDFLSDKQIQGNKIIALFMELETPDGVYFEYLLKDGNRSKLTHFLLLEYHLSWDWLMPVCSKIDTVCGIDLHEWDQFINESLESKNINIVFSAVVEFIEWYNQNK